MTLEQLEQIILSKRLELGKLFEQQGLNDYTLRKSQELDILVVNAQRLYLKRQYKERVKWKDV